MKQCSACTLDYDEEFKFCPECGHKFGGAKLDELQDKLNQNLMNMKMDANREGALSRRVFSGDGLGDSIIPGRVYGRD